MTLSIAAKAHYARALDADEQKRASMAPKTVNMKWLSHLSSILQWASNTGQIDFNPAQGIRARATSGSRRPDTRLSGLDQP